MSQALDSLETRVDQMLGLLSSLRSENESLRARVASLDADKRALEQKIDVTASRLEALMESLPTE
jgi:uncharacterized protein (TIGR02449 family)